MTVEMTLEEAQIVIAVLTFAEGAALGENPSIVEALRALHDWRSALLRHYIVARLNEAAEVGSPA